MEKCIMFQSNTFLWKLDEFFRFSLSFWWNFSLSCNLIEKQKDSVQKESSPIEQFLRKALAASTELLVSESMYLMCIIKYTPMTSYNFISSFNILRNSFQQW